MVTSVFSPSSAFFLNLHQYQLHWYRETDKVNNGKNKIEHLKKILYVAIPLYLELIIIDFNFLVVLVKCFRQLLSFADKAVFYVFSVMQ